MLALLPSYPLAATRRSVAAEPAWSAIKTLSTIGARLLTLADAQRLSRGPGRPMMLLALPTVAAAAAAPGQANGGKRSPDGHPLR
jgi:hypothetical protein